MRLLMVQVVQHDISQLMKSLLKWPREQIQIFLTSLVNYMTKEMIKGVTLSTKLKE